MTAEPRITFSDWETRIRREEAEKLNGKPMEEWGSEEIAEHCRAAKAFVPLKTQEELDRDYSDYKLSREEALGYSAPEPPKVILWVLGGIVVTVVTVAALAANASTLVPEEFPPTGGPSFIAEGPQYLIGGKWGEGILANCASGMCDVPMLRDGEYVTAFETYQETGSYDYLGDPSPVPLPAGGWLLLSAVGSLAAWRMKG